MIEGIRIRARFSSQWKRIADTLPNRERESLRRSLTEAREFGRSLIRRQFKSRRLVRAFGFRRLRANRRGAQAQFGYVSGKRAFLGNFYEESVTIRPRKRSKLWVPIGANRTRAGRTRMTPREAISAGAFVQESRAGNLIAFRKSDKRPLFTLEDSIRLDARPVFRPTWDRFRPQLIANLERDVVTPLRQAN